MRRRRGRGSRVGGVESAGRGASAARAAGGGGRRPGAEPRPGASGRAGHAERRRTAGPLGGGARACRLGPSGRARADRRGDRVAPARRSPGRAPARRGNRRRRLPLAPRKPPARARDRRRRTALAGPARGGVAGARAGARDRERRGLSQAVRGRFSAPAGLLEPLSEREQAVLRLLPTLLSYTEIGSELFVAVNTVKTHVKSVYRKLDVSNRRDAVARARALRLI